MEMRSQRLLIVPYLTSAKQQSEFLYSRGRKFSRDKPKSRLRFNHLDDRKVVNVIIAKNFDQTSEELQIQALEVRGSLPSRFGPKAHIYY